MESATEKPFLKKEEPVLSVILPALHADSEYLRCVYAIRASLAEEVSFEIVSVVRNAEEFASLEASDLHIVPERTRGIYEAMNQGIECSRGKYLYFIGQDDILLPEAAKAISVGMAREADIILGNVFWGADRIFRNPSSPQSLVWRNWCHQGMIYRRDALAQKRLEYPSEFRVQADHYVNIVLAGRPGKVRIVKHKGCIAWYSAGGFSTIHIDEVFRKQFPSLIRKHFGILSYWMVISRRALLKAVRMSTQR